MAILRIQSDGDQIEGFLGSEIHDLGFWGGKAVVILASVFFLVGGGED